MTTNNDNRNYSNFPNGFDGGVLIQELLVSEPVGSKIFWVGNNPVIENNEKQQSDTNKGTFHAPFATIDFAIGQCSADNNNVICVRSGYTQTITAAAGIAADVAGVYIVGVGQGSNRPTISFSTSTAASIAVSADNVTFKNFKFVCNISAQNHMFDLTGKSTNIINCEFVEGSQSPLSFIAADGDDADIDNSNIINCKFSATTVGGMVNGILLGKDFTNVSILGCEINGDFGAACISVPAGGQAQVNLQIGNCIITNLTSGQHAIEVSGVGSTGKLYDTYIETDDQSTSVTAGGLEVYNVFFHHGFNDGVDQGQAIPLFEPITPASAGLNSLLGIRVRKPAAVLPASTTDNLFTVTGRVLITKLVGEVTNGIQTQACNTKVNNNPTIGTTTILASNVDIDGLENGATLTVEGDGTALVLGDGGTSLGALGGMNLEVAAGTIELETAATNTGATKWELWYIALDDSAFVVAA